MATRFYKPTKFDSESIRLIQLIDEIITDYSEQGFDMSVRQIYYQLVTRNEISNEEKSYNKIKSLINDARLAGFLDWDTVVDRGRETAIKPTWKNAGDIMDIVAKQYAINLWDDQPTYVEIMVEKQALEGILEPVAMKWGVPFTANKGYSSASNLYQAGMRIHQAMKQGKHIEIMYLGDHDPSGLDMTRDIEERLKLFSIYQFYHTGDPETYEEAVMKMQTRKFQLYTNSDFKNISFNINRLALNMSQVREYDPPPNPAKMQDSRAADYVSRYGDESWELDALEPSVLAELVDTKIEKLIMWDNWNKRLKLQEDTRKELEEISKKFKPE